MIKKFLNIINKIKYFLKKKFFFIESDKNLGKNKETKQNIENQDNKYILDENTLKEKKELFEKIEIGNVIYSRMPLDEEKLKTIPQGHEVRPYFVVGKKENSVIAYPASHKKPKNVSWKWIYVIYKSRNEIAYKNDYIVNNETNSYFNLKTYYEIPMENIINIFMIPAYGDTKRLERTLTILENEGNDVYKMNIDFPINEGNIIKKGESLFYVYSSTRNQFYAHPIYINSNPHIKNELIIELPHEILYIDINNQVKLDKDDYKYIIKEYKRDVVETIELDKKNLKYELKKLSTEDKKTNKIKKQINNLKFYYIPGQIFYDKFYRDSFVYLYTLYDMHYGYVKSEIDSNIQNIQIVETDDLYEFERMDRYNKDEIKSILSNQIKESNKHIFEFITYMLDYPDTILDKHFYLSDDDMLEIKYIK